MLHPWPKHAGQPFGPWVEPPGRMFHPLNNFFLKFGWWRRWRWGGGSGFRKEKKKRVKLKTFDGVGAILRSCGTMFSIPENFHYSIFYDFSSRTSQNYPVMWIHKLGRYDKKLCEKGPFNNLVLSRDPKKSIANKDLITHFYLLFRTHGHITIMKSTFRWFTYHFPS